MPWRRPSERTEIVHIVVTGYQKRKHPRKYYVSRGCSSYKFDAKSFLGGQKNKYPPAYGAQMQLLCRKRKFNIDLSFKALHVNFSIVSVSS